MIYFNKKQKETIISKLGDIDFTKAEYDYFMNNCCFTDREKAILNYHIKGYGNDYIAMELYCSPSTIDKDIRKIKKKILKVITKM